MSAPIIACIPVGAERDPARSGAFQAVGTEGKFFHQDRENRMRQITGLKELRERGMMTWIEQEHGWVAAPEEIVKAFSKDGFEECNRETTTSRRDWQPPGGGWRGVDTRTGSVASAIWVNRPPWHQAIMAGGVWQAARTKSVASPIWVDRPAWDQAIVFIDIDGESLVGAQALSGCAISKPLDQREYDHGSPRLECDPYEKEGGAVSGAAVSS